MKITSVNFLLIQISHQKKGEFLLSLKYRTVCPTKSKHFVLVDTLGEKDLFRANQLYTIVKSIPAYPYPTNEFKWNLGYRRAFSWSSECKNDESYTLSEVKRRLNLEEDKSNLIGLWIVASV